MSVVVETSLGDIIIDLHKQANLASKNFIKLCKAKFYNGALFYNVQKDYLASIKTINPPTTIYNNQPFFEDQIHPLLRHNTYGVVATSNSKPQANNSDFYILLTQNAPQLDSKHTVFGQVMEGFQVLEQLNTMHIDEDGRPLLNIRIKHTYILEDPYEDDTDMKYPSRSPSPNYKAEGRVEFEEKIAMEEDEEQLIKKAKQHQAKKRAVTLEMLGDIPDADMKPPENVLYVCKLNPVTEEKDLEVIFSKFGGIKSCEVVRDWKTGSSLQYAFVEFETIASCEEAYMKMENALIDERRIHVDFCQSAHQQWSLLQRAQRKKKELNLQRELAQKSRNKEQSLIEQLELKKDYFHTKSNHSLVVDQQEIQRLKEEQLEIMLKQQLENQQKLKLQQNLQIIGNEKKKKDKKSKKDSKEKDKKKKTKRSDDRSRSTSESTSRRRKDKTKDKYRPYKGNKDILREKPVESNNQKKVDKSKDDNKKEKKNDIEKDKTIPEDVVQKEIDIQEKEREKEKQQKEKEQIEKYQREKELKDKEQKEKEQKEQKEKELKEKEQKDKEKERQRQKERDKEREKERIMREKERQQEKEREKEKQRQKDKQKEKEQTKLDKLNKQKQEQEKKQQQQDKKKLLKKKRSSSSSSSSDDSNSSSSSSSSDSDSSSETSSSSSSMSDK